MFLLAVLRRLSTGGSPQADRGLMGVGDALRCHFAVLVESHLLIGDDAVHVVPRPANHKSSAVGNEQGQRTGPSNGNAHLLDAFLFGPSHSCFRWRRPSSCGPASCFGFGSNDWLPGVRGVGLGSANPFTRTTAFWDLT